MIDTKRAKKGEGKDWAWADRAIEKSKGLLKVEDLVIEARVKDIIQGNKYTVASTRIGFTGMNTYVDLRSDLGPDKEGYVTILHEMLHVAQNQHFVVMNSIYKLFPNKTVRKHVKKLWEDANEQIVERLAQGLYGIIMEENTGNDTDTTDNTDVNDTDSTNTKEQTSSPNDTWQV